MIDIQYTKIINLTIQDEEDINTFVSLITKLLVASKQTGFKKPFNDSERFLITNIAEMLGLEDKTNDCRINSEREQVVEQNKDKYYDKKKK